MEKRYYGVYMPYWLRQTGTESVASVAEREERQRRRNRRNRRLSESQRRQVYMMRRYGLDREEISLVVGKTADRVSEIAKKKNPPGNG